MAKQLTDEQRQEVIDLLPTGKSCNEIARLTGRGVTTVSRIAASVGHDWGHSNLARAHDARKAYGAEARATLASRLHAAADKLIDQLDRPHLVYNFGGRDNTYEEHQLDEPDVASKLNLIRGVREAMRTVLDIDRHDNRAEDGLAAVDEWLRDMLGQAS